MAPAVADLPVLLSKLETQIHVSITQRGTAKLSKMPVQIAAPFFQGASGFGVTFRSLILGNGLDANYPGRKASLRQA